MADPKRTVEIAIKVTGTNTKDLGSIASSFAQIGDAVKTATTRIESFKAFIQSISAPKDLSNFASELDKLKDIKIPNLAQIASGFERLAKIGTPQNLDKFANEVKKFSDIKVANVKRLAEGFQLLSDETVDAQKAGGRLRVLYRNLKNFSDLKLPKLPEFVASIKELNSASLSVGDAAKRFRVLYRNLKDFSLIKIPSLKDFIKSINELNSSSVSVGDAAKRFRVLYRNLKNFTSLKIPSLTSFINSLKELEKLRITTVVNNMLRLNAAIKQLSSSGQFTAFQTFARDLRSISTVLTSASAKMSSFAAKTKSAGNSFTDFGVRLKAYSQYMAASNLLKPVEEGIRTGIQAIGEYDQSLKDLQAITNATDLQVAQMGDKILEVAETTKFSASEIAEGMRIIGQAGFTAGEAIQVMGDVSNLSTGTLSDMATSVDLVTTTLRVFSLSAFQSGEVADVFANAVNRSKLTLDKLKTAMQYVGPIAKSANVSFKDLAAAMGVLANSGLQSSQIGTGLRRILAELISPSKKLRAAAAAVGVTLESLNPRTNSLQDVLSNLKIVLSDSSVAFDIFGKRGAAASLALTKDVGSYIEMTDNLSETGAALRQAEKQMEGLGVSFKNLQDRAKNLAIALGDAGLTTLFRAMIDIVRELIVVLTAIANNGFVQAAAKVAFMTISISAAAKAFLALKAAIAGSNLVTAISLAAANATGLASFFGGLVTLLGGPVVWAIAAVVAAITGLVYWLSKSRKDVEDNAKEMAKMADAYTIAAEKVNNYRTSTANMDEDSKEHLNANMALRKELTELVKKYPELSDVAGRAVLSISPVTGALNDGGEAIKQYQKELAALETTKLADSVKASNEALKLNVGWWGKLKDAVRAGLNGPNADNAKLREIFEAVENGTASLSELNEKLKQFGQSSNLSSQVEYMREHLASLTAELDSMYDNFLKTGEINMNTTIEEVQALGDRTKLTQQQTDYLIERMEKMQNLGNQNIGSTIAKWAKEIKDWDAEDYNGSTSPVDSLVKQYQQEIEIVRDGEKAKVALFSDAQVEKAKMYDAEKADLVDRYNAEEESYKQATKAAGSNLAEQQRLAKEHTIAVAAIEKDKNDLVAQMASDADYQELLRIAEAGKRRDEAQRTLDDTYFSETEEGYRQHGQRQAEIVENYTAEIQKLKEKQIDPKQIVNLLKSETEELKAAEAEKLQELEASYILGNETKLQYETKKAAIEREYGEKRVAIAKEYEDQLVSNAMEGTKEYKKVHTAKLNAEIDLGNKLNENAAAINKERLSLEKQQVSNIVKVYKDNINVLSDNVSASVKLMKSKLELAFKDNLVDTSALNSISATLKKNFSEIAAYSKDSFEKVSDHLQEAFDNPKNKDRILALGEYFNDSAETAIDAYQNAKSKITSILDSIASQQQKLTAKLRKLQETQANSEQETADLRSSLRQATMTEAQKLAETVSNANDKLRKSDELYTKAMQSNGAAREEYLKQSYESAKDAQDAAEALISVVEDGHDAEVAKAKEMESWNKKTDKSDSERISHLQKIQQYDKEIAAGKSAEVKAQQLINSLDEKKTRALEQLNKDYQSMVDKLEAAKVKFQEMNAEADKMIAKFQSAIKIDFNTDEAQSKLQNVMNSLDFKMDFDDTVMSEKIVKVGDTWTNVWEQGNKAFQESADGINSDLSSFTEEIVKVGDTWTNVWTQSKDSAANAIKDANEELKKIEDSQLKTNVEITGSGSATLPISEKIESIKDHLSEISDQTIEVMVKVLDMKKLDEAKTKLEALMAYDGKSITITTISKTVEQKRWGGLAGVTKLARGGKLPGFGGGDKIRALLEAGEFVVRKEAVAKYGAAFLSRLNSLRLPSMPDMASVVTAKIGGMIPNMSAPVVSMNALSPIAVQQSGMGGLKDFGKVMLSNGDVKFPAIAHRNVIAELNRHLKKSSLMGANR